MKKKLSIEWRHLDLNSVTCSRCSATGKNLQEGILELTKKFKDDLEISYIESKLGKEKIKESNLVLINGVEIEKILEGVTVAENECASCCDILQEQTCCRTLVEEDGTVNEEISKELFLKAAYVALKETVVKEKVAPCCCSAVKETNVIQQKDQFIWKAMLGLFLWIGLYLNLPSFSKFITYSLFSLQKGSHLGASVEFFFLDVPKVFLLLVLIVFFVGIIRSFFTPEKTRKILTGKKESVGNVLAALLGIVTPFCSCSAVPLFIGFVSAGIPLGVTFSFLISAPMVNEIALVLLYGMFGWRVALLYLSTGIFIAIVSGWIIGRLKMEKYIEEWVEKANTSANVEDTNSKQWSERIEYGKQAVKEILAKIWPYVILGIAVGAGIHGYVPEDFMASIMGKESWWSVPLAVLIGVPLYSNAAGIIPIVHALLEKGAALGTVLAFMMAVIGLSLPEIIILRKVLKMRLILIFVGIVAFGILMIGYLFNFIF